MVYSFYSSIRSGRSTGAPKVVDLVQLRYRDDIEYKLRHTDEEWSKLSHYIDTTIIFLRMAPTLYSSQLPILKSKWDDHQNQKSVFPAEFHTFYDSTKKVMFFCCCIRMIKTIRP